MNSKNNKQLALIMLTTILIVSGLSTVFLAANAQGQATLVVLDSVGGTVSPSGTNTYADGTAVTLTATATDQTYVFVNWVISTDAGSSTSTENPLTLTAVGGITYAVQAVFQPIQAPPGGTLPTSLTGAAIVVVLASAGGTVSPAPGTYALANAVSLNLQATAQSGWQFSHWTISGSSTDHGGAPVNLTPTDNPYNVNHGYGYTYYYQAVFTPVGGSVPTPTPSSSTGGSIGGLSSDMLIIIALVVVIVVILAAFGAYAYRKNKHP